MKRRNVILLLMLIGTIAQVATVALYLAAPQPERLGVPNDHLAKYRVAAAAFPQPFKAGRDQDNARKNARLWGVDLPLNPGPQPTDDCVAAGLSHALHSRMFVATRGRTTIFEPFPPYLYGTARVTEGENSPPCRTGGAYPTFAIEAFRKHGFVSYAEADAKWDRRTSDTWGCGGPPAKLLDVGRKRAGGDAYPIRSIDEWRDALCNGYPVTVAIPWQPGRPYRRGDRVFVPFNGTNRGGHQIASIGYDGRDGKATWCIINSHGAKWPDLENDDDTPAGACWVEEKWAEWIVDNGELWAINHVPGFQPDEIDWDAFDRLSRRPTRNPPIAAFRSKEVARAPQTTLAP